MKTTVPVVLLTVLMISITAFEWRHTEVDAKEKIGLQVITALQRSSVHEFTALFPTLSDFHGLMLRNAEMYGVNLNEAAREFEKEFEEILFPEFKNSFERILNEGRSAGIDWRTIRFASVQVAEPADSSFSSAPMTISFTSNGEVYHLKVEKALMIDGEWKLSQHISFEK